MPGHCKSPHAVQHVNSTRAAEVNASPKTDALPSKGEPPLCPRSFAIPRARPRHELHVVAPFSAGGGSSGGGGGGKSAGKSKRWGKSSGKGQGWKRGGDGSDGDDADEDDGGKLYIKVRVLQSARCL